MRKVTSLLFAAGALALLPLAGCTASDLGVAESTSEAPEPDNSDATEPLTNKITAANQEGNAEVTIMGPESWYSWGPGEIVDRGVILFTELDADDLWLSVQVRDGWPHACTPENLATQKCQIFGSEYLSYETLETITIGGYDAPGFEYVDDFDGYKTREQHRLLDVDGAPMSITIITTAIDEDLPQVLFDIRDSLTVEFVE